MAVLQQYCKMCEKHFLCLRNTYNNCQPNEFCHSQNASKSISAGETPLGSLQRSPRPLIGFKGAALQQERMIREREREKERKESRKEQGIGEGMNGVE